jgi:hypothetical protein
LKLEATPARTHGQAAVWVGARSVGPLLHADAHPQSGVPSGFARTAHYSAVVKLREMLMKRNVRWYSSFGVAVAIASTVVLQADATPFTLDYSVSVTPRPSGSNFMYSFVLTLDNHDGSWAPGQGFNWFVIGASASFPGAFPEGASFFTSVPAGFVASASSGGQNGPRFV